MTASYFCSAHPQATLGQPPLYAPISAIDRHTTPHLDTLVYGARVYLKMFTLEIISVIPVLLGFVQASTIASIPTHHSEAVFGY